MPSQALRTHRPWHANSAVGPFRNHRPTSLEAYFQSIHDTPLLTADQEKALARRIRRGDTRARDHMIRANLRLVVNIARRYIGKGLELPDLIAEGNIGLLRAVDDFNPAMGTRFSTYACHWIKQAIRQALKYTTRTIRIPAYMVDLLIKWRQTAARLRDELGRPPTREEVARCLRIPRKRLAGLQQAIKVCDSSLLNDHSDDNWPFEETLTDSRTKTADTALGDAEEQQMVHQLLDTLDQREATVLRLRFGFDDEDTHTLHEIGERLGLTRERVRQLQSEALRKLAERLVARRPPSGPDAEMPDFVSL
jgi:RNA polymerase primary sigma factor